MRAAVYHGPRDIRLDEVADPTPRDGYVIVKVDRVGICGTDKGFYTGKYAPRKIPIILGHEFTGVIVDVSRGIDGGLVGSRIVSEINITCGSCWYCKNGLRNHCRGREAIGISIDGALSEYIALPLDNIHIVDLDQLSAVFVEPLASVLEIASIYPPRPGSNIAVVGSGTIALLALQVLKYYSPNLVACIVRGDSPKRGLAGKFSDIVIPVEEVHNFIGRSLGDRMGFDYVVEATGSPEGLKTALGIVRPRGVIALKSTLGEYGPINLGRIVVDEVTIVGSRCGPFKPAIRMLRDRYIVVDELVTDIYPLERVREAFERSIERSSIKVVISIP